MKILNQVALASILSLSNQALANGENSILKCTNNAVADNGFEAIFSTGEDGAITRVEVASIGFSGRHVIGNPGCELGAPLSDENRVEYVCRDDSLEASVISNQPVNSMHVVHLNDAGFFGEILNVYLSCNF